MSPAVATEILYKKGIRFISGKFFNGKTEIKDFCKYLWNIQELRINSTNDTKNIKDAFIERYGENGRWPEMPIVEEARNVDALMPLAFPLNYKQLLYINRLIKGEDEMMFILCGCGGSGKSTFANIVKQIFDGDVASLNLEDLSSEFKLATGVNKRLIYSDELNASDIDNGVIKTIISKQAININPKFEKGFDVNWQGTLFFSCNKPPKLDLSDSGIVRRICYFYMNTKIDSPDRSLQKKVYTHEELVNIVAHALAIDDSDWYRCFKFETRKLLRETNSVYLCANNGDYLNTPYTDYKYNCNSKNIKPFAQPKWENIKNLFEEWESELNEDLPF